ncbi:unnamed protein product [Vicia faba]|uniref:Uncharacterized protein n=1 Tax=Vicia faba TaxID=3906 RepID=A0AAV1AL26_VICFA|nr:unnamed protein product [Vicia faba]
MNLESLQTVPISTTNFRLPSTFVVPPYHSSHILFNMGWCSCSLSTCNGAHHHPDDSACESPSPLSVYFDLNLWFNFRSTAEHLHQFLTGRGLSDASLTVTPTTGKPEGELRLMRIDWNHALESVAEGDAGKTFEGSKRRLNHEDKTKQLEDLKNSHCHFQIWRLQLDFYKEFWPSTKQARHWNSLKELQGSSHDPQASLKFPTLSYPNPAEGDLKANMRARRKLEDRDEVPGPWAPWALCF